jgi:UDP-N-acetylglucosamine pyrophosphorylase
MEKANNMSTETRLWTLDEINDEAATTEVTVSFTIQKTQYVALNDIDARWKKLWKKTSNGYEEIDIKAMTKTIAAYLAKTMKLEQLLEDKIRHEPIENILSLLQRVEKKAVVKPHRGCFYLEVKGKQGKPLELDL